MATLNLGNIKFNWKGAYAGGTAYVVDDVVSYSGSSYICKLASTGNLPTNGTYWDQMSSAGTDGTDLTTTLTTQGDIVYRDGSGLQRLAAGTAGQILQTGGSGANPSWTTMSSDMVKIVTATGGGTTALALDSCFSATYENYIIVASLFSSGGNMGAYFRLQNSSNTEQQSSYYYIGYQGYRGSSPSSNDNKSGWNTSEISMQENINNEGDQFGSFVIHVIKPFVSTCGTNMHFDYFSYDGTYMRTVKLNGAHRVAQSNAGFRFTSSNSNTFSTSSKVTVYGLKV